MRNGALRRLFRLFQIFSGDRSQLPGHVVIAAAFGQPERAIRLLSEMFRLHRQEQSREGAEICDVRPFLLS